MYYCTITMFIVLLYYNNNYCTITESTDLSNHWRPFYFCTTTESDKPFLCYCTVTKSAKLGYYCTKDSMYSTIWTKICHVSIKSCINSWCIKYKSNHIIWNCSIFLHQPLEFVVYLASLYHHVSLIIKWYYTTLLLLYKSFLNLQLLTDWQYYIHSY